MENGAKGDFIDRKVSGFERIFDRFFDAVQSDPKSFFLVILVITNLASLYKYTQSLENRLHENRNYSDKMIFEVRNQLQPELNNSIEEETHRIEIKVDSVINSLGKLKETILKPKE